MKKFLAVLIAAVCAATLSALCACSFVVEDDDNWLKVTDDKYEAWEMLDTFIEKTYGNSSYTVTVKEDDEVVRTEMIGGCTAHVIYADESEVWVSDGDNDEYVIYAAKIGDTKIYRESLNFDYYFENHAIYADELNDYIDAFDEETASFLCTASGEKTTIDDVSVKVSSLTLEFTDEEMSLTVNAAAIDGLVTNYTVTYTENGETVTKTVTFDYDAEPVALPDTTDWDKWEWTAEGEFTIDDIDYSLTIVKTNEGYSITWKDYDGVGSAVLQPKYDALVGEGTDDEGDFTIELSENDEGILFLRSWDGFSYGITFGINNEI